jgi:hypothetical protein
VAGISELLSVYENADALVQAEDALDRIAAMELSEDLPLGDYYDGLAEATVGVCEHRQHADDREGR